jgi:hypothetical protein
VSKIPVFLLAAVTAASLIGCSPDKQRGAEDIGGGNNKVKFDAYGFNLSDDNVGRDKGPVAMYYRTAFERREPRLIQQLARQAEKIPGVADVQVISYQDNLIVGVQTIGVPRQDVINTEVDVRQTPAKAEALSIGNTDALQRRIANDMRANLQAETRYNILFVSTNPVIYQRVADVNQRISRGQRVTEDELRILLNDIGYTTKGYNLVD